MARMRTIKETIALLKQEDADTKVTEYYLRSLVLTKKIPTCRAGRKILINYDLLMDYFNNPDQEYELLNTNPSFKEYGKIRPL